MMGAHPQGVAASELARAGEYFGISPATIRVALTRIVASDEAQRVGSTYHLGSRLIARQQRQTEHASQIAWDGTWEMAVIVATSRPGRDRANLRDTLTTARLGELREGIWMRPANLSRPPTYASPGTVRTFRATPGEDPTTIAASLWDLHGWADEASAILTRLENTREPAPRLAVAAHLVRHLASDPLLPPELWADWWPSARAREAYSNYQKEFNELYKNEFTRTTS